jgi:integrase
MDIYYHDTRLNWIQRKVRTDPKITAENKKAIFEFDRQLLIDGMKRPTRVNYLSILYVLGRKSRNGFRTSTRKDIEYLIAFVNGNGFTEWTREKYFVIMRRFFSKLGIDVSWIRLKSRNELMNNHIPEQLLDKPEERAVLKSIDKLMDRTITALLAEGGFRIGEVLPLETKSIAFDRYGVRLIVTGKTGMRAVPLIRCDCDHKNLAVNLLEKWLDKREFETPYAFNRTFIQGEDRGKPRGLSHRYIRHVFEMVNDSRVIQKHVHPHLFRHTRATQLANFLTEFQLCNYFGWTYGSQTPRVYVRLAGKDIINSLLKAYGMKPTEKMNPCLWCN